MHTFYNQLFQKPYNELNNSEQIEIISYFLKQGRKNEIFNIVKTCYPNLDLECKIYKTSFNFEKVSLVELAIIEKWYDILNFLIEKKQKITINYSLIYNSLSLVKEDFIFYILNQTNFIPDAPKEFITPTKPSLIRKCLQNHNQDTKIFEIILEKSNFFILESDIQEEIKQMKNLNHQKYLIFNEFLNSYILKNRLKNHLKEIDKEKKIIL